MTASLSESVPADFVAVSVVVLNHNRSAILKRVLRSLVAQRGVDLEILVVDNASTDGAPDMVRRDFPQVRLLAQSENEGIRGRNVGFRAARGEIVLSLDNDIELVSPDSLARIVARFVGDERLGALSLKITEEATGDAYVEAHWWHPAPRLANQDREFPTDHFNEAAVAFRAEALKRAGYYYEPLFWGGEEWDLTLGIMDLGYDLHYFPEPVLHLAPRGKLDTQADERHALLVRNRCWIALRRLPLWSAVLYVVPRLAIWGLRSLRHGYFGVFLRGLGDLLRRLPSILGDRRPISRETFARLRGVRPGVAWGDLVRYA